MSSDIVEFIGIYDADSTLIGEVTYWIQARIGGTHCALCDITHGMFMQKRSWQDCQKQLPVPFRTFHRNDAPSDALDAAGGMYPIVLAKSPQGLSVILTPQELNTFNGDPVQFVERLQTFL